MTEPLELAAEIFDKETADHHCREPYWTATDDEVKRFAAALLERRGASEQDYTRAVIAERDQLRAYNRQLIVALNGCIDAINNCQPLLNPHKHEGYAKNCVDANNLAIEVALVSLGALT